jgi:predicted nucleotidyltransferase
VAVQAEIDRALPQQVVDEIVRRVLSVCKPDRIILFGSAATGGMTRDSDIDLLIVEPELEWKAEVWLDERLRIADAIGCTEHPVDVRLTTTERFERFKDIIGGIEYPANKYGRVIYESARR